MPDDPVEDPCVENYLIVSGAGETPSVDEGTSRLFHLTWQEPCLNIQIKLEHKQNNVWIDLTAFFTMALTNISTQTNPTTSLIEGIGDFYTPGGAGVGDYKLTFYTPSLSVTRYFEVIPV